jgi:hypothetical protein
MELSRDVIKTMFIEWEEGLTVEEREALYEYSKHMSSEINPFLMDGIANSIETIPESQDIVDAINIIDRALKKFTSKVDILVYRSEVHDSKWTPSDLKEFLEGVRRIEYKQFVSTSFTLEAGKDFLELLKQKYGDRVYLFIKAKIPIGKNIGYLSKNLSAMGDSEDEILISRDITLELEKIRLDDLDTVCIEGYFS